MHSDESDSKWNQLERRYDIAFLASSLLRSSISSSTPAVGSSPGRQNAFSDGLSWYPDLPAWTLIPSDANALQAASSRVYPRALKDAHALSNALKSTPAPAPTRGSSEL